MEPSKKLMRDFAKVVLPGYNPCAYCYLFHKGLLGYDLQELETVITLASKWWTDNYYMWALELGASMHWRVINTANDLMLSQHKDLPTAIMKAVVEAAKK